MKENTSPKKTLQSDGGTYDAKHRLIGLVLGAVVLWLLMVTVFLITGGERVPSRAQDFSFDEDFSSTVFQDPNTTADWDTAAGEASLFHGEWTHLSDHTLKGTQQIQLPVPIIPGQTAYFIDCVDCESSSRKIIFTNTPSGAPHIDATLYYAEFNPGLNQWQGLDPTDGIPTADRLTGSPLDPLNGKRQQLLSTHLKFDSSGDPIVHWTARDVIGDIRDLVITRWCPGAGRWRDMTCSTDGEENITGNTTNFQESSMDLDAAGNPHMVSSEAPATLHYRRWNSTAPQWEDSNGNPGSEVVPITVGALGSYRFGIGGPTSSTVYVAYGGAPGGLIGGVKKDFGGPAWTAWDETFVAPPNFTVLSAPGGVLFQLLFDPFTGNPHVLWRDICQARHGYWDETNNLLKDQAGNVLVAAGEPIGGSSDGCFFTAAFHPTIPDDMHILLNATFTQFLHWDGTAWSPHPKHTVPETIPGSAPSQVPKMVVGPDGVPLAILQFNSANTIPMTRYTDERVDEVRNIIQSTAVDSTDLPIQRATLTLSGVSQGVNGTQPLNSNGRNAYVDVDLKFSNDGINFYSATVGDEFIFPTKGTSLMYILTLDSGTLLDRPVIDSVHIDYSTATGQPNLTLLKNVDTNGDGAFVDDGQKVKPGDFLTYQIRVANTGDAPLADVVVKDTLPPGTTYVSNSVTLNGSTVPDSGGTNHLFTSGLNIGTLDSGDFVQTDWSDGPGQATYGSFTRFASEDGTRWRTPEVLKMPTDNMFADEGFAAAGSTVQLDQTQAGGDTASDFLDLMGHQGAVMLNDGRLFATWWKDFDGSAGSGHVVGRFFSRSGVPIGSEIIISSTSPGVEFHQRPTAVQLATGDIIVAWNRVDFSTSTEVVMQRITSTGSLVGPSEIVVDSGGPFFTTFVDLDNANDFGIRPKSALAADNVGNFFMAWMKSTGAFPGCGVAYTAGFDSTASPLPNFPTTQINETIGPENCTVRQAPSIALGQSGKLMAAFSTAPFSTGKIRIASIDFSGVSPVVSGPVDLFSAGTTVRVGPLGTLPGGENVVAWDSGSTPLMQKFSDSLVPIGAPVSGAGQRSALVGDSTLGRVIESTTFGSSTLFDENLAAISGAVTSPSSANADIDPSTQREWIIGGEGNIFGKLLQYEPSTHELFSSVIDSGQPSTWGTLDTTQLVPAGSDLKIFVRTGNTPTPDASWSLFTEVTPGTEIPAGLNGTRYLQYKVEFSHANVSVTPELHDITMSRQGIATIEFQVQVNATSGTIIGNTVTATAANGAIVGVATTQNAVGDPTVEVIGGPNRIDTAILVAQKLFPTAGTAGAVVLIRSDDLVEGLSGAPLAAQLNAPILLTPTDHLDSRVLAEIKRLIDPSKRVVLLGRERALSENVLNQVRAAGFLNTQRYGGPERTATSALIAQALQNLEPAMIREAFIANAYVPADALSSSSPASIKAATSTRKPVLLTHPDGFSPEMLAYLNAHPNLTKFFIAGGLKAVGTNPENSLRALPQNPSIERIAGPERFATSAEVADRFFPTPAQIFIMSGTAFPGRTLTGQFIDALLVGPIAARNGAPALFVDKSFVPDAIRDYVLRHRGTIGKITVIGGPNSIEPAVYQEMLNLLK